MPSYRLRVCTIGPFTPDRLSRPSATPISKPASFSSDRTRDFDRDRFSQNPINVHVRPALTALGSIGPEPIHSPNLPFRQCGTSLPSFLIPSRDPIHAQTSLGECK